jgi:hypothetical protein
VDRGQRGHIATQNLLAEDAERAGFVPLSPGPGEPEYDVAWQDDDDIVVVEVKGLIPANEVRQLRLGLGQLLDYRSVLAGLDRTVRAVLAVERAPLDSRWVSLCAEVDVALVWPETFESLF